MSPGGGRKSRFFDENMREGIKEHCRLNLIFNKELKELTIQLKWDDEVLVENFIHLDHGHNFNLGPPC